jgi:hypothetical protein
MFLLHNNFSLHLFKKLPKVRFKQPKIHVRISDVLVKSNKSMNVLGVTIDCKLDWKEHIDLTIKKSNVALYTT